MVKKNLQKKKDEFPLPQKQSKTQMGMIKKDTSMGYSYFETRSR